MNTSHVETLVDQYICDLESAMEVRYKTDKFIGMTYDLQNVLKRVLTDLSYTHPESVASALSVLDFYKKFQ